MPITLGLMGFGRIGRNVFRILHRSERFRIGAISDIADPEALTYLLRYDTILGRFPDQVTFKEGHLYTWGREIPVVQGRDPGDVRWSDYGVDYVIEATGRQRRRAESERHLEMGARRVVLCAPPAEPSDVTIVYGINQDRLRPNHRIISNASSTAHCAAPVLRVLDNAFGIQRAHLSSVHAFTGGQRLADVPSDELRLSRAAGENIVPSSTNAVAVIEEVLPEMQGRLAAAALRVPVANGSIVDMTIWFEKPVTVNRINEVMRTAASGPYLGILEYNEDPIVSSDVAHSSYSSTFDAQATMVLEGSLAKVIAWFDNSWGYSHRVVQLVDHLAQRDGLSGEESR
ncbi:MAG: type I glyceraldehyde-3-phosphate dehydrogenase [Acidobacteriota bacterium]|nr:MAG: type I glyceraldehyde-3-phosphate dehydrogenase [Acidobacteriota bacterium]